MDAIFEEIRSERARQDAKWGGPDHDDKYMTYQWWGIVRFVIDRSDRTPRQKFIRVAAVCVAAIESIDRFYAKTRAGALTDEDTR